MPTLSQREVSCRVVDDTSILAARAMIRKFGAEVGFEREVIEELVVVISELASNILKYGTRGSISLRELEQEMGPRGIEILAKDEAPPFDLMGSLRDGYDAKGKLDPALVFGRRGIGAGLGAVARLSDRIELVPHESPAVGKSIVVRRVVGRPRRGSSPGF